ncbi:MAG: hypothetical protein K2H85_06190, partial [Allobaculum sp.]|nr:hypothetical protein [Allobaculum sp.]
MGNCRTVNNPKKKKTEDKGTEKEKIELYYKSLPTHDIQEKYLEATGYLSLDELMKAVDKNKKVSVPEQMLCDEAVTFLTELNNDLKRITNADDAELKKIINEYQTRFVALTGGTSDEPNRTSDVYEAIYLAFVKHGY